MSIEKKRSKALRVTRTDVYDALSEIEKIKPPATFGELIKSLRLCDEISQTELAAKLNISKQHLSAIENGAKAVSIARAAKFAKALGYPVDQFVIAAIEDELRATDIDLHVDLKKIIGG